MLVCLFACLLVGWSVCWLVVGWLVLFRFVSFCVGLFVLVWGGGGAGGRDWGGGVVLYCIVLFSYIFLSFPLFLFVCFQRW